MSFEVINIDAIVTDIEGTTSSIAFVKEVLFPYADRQMTTFLRDHWDDPRVAQALADVREESGEALTSPEHAATLLRAWIAEDRKATPLKTLQGMIWKAGYENVDYRAHIYPDAARRLRDWHQIGLPLYVYSSGSIAAQKLFFGHCEAGDLTPLFSGYFDTTIGAKKDADSYRAIVGEIRMAPQRVLFLSDVEAELDAAREAGLRTALLDRDQAIADSSHFKVASFDAIEL